MGFAISQALCDRAELLARAHPIAAVAEILRIERSTIYAMRERGWRATSAGRNRRPRPGDFAIWSGREGRDALCRRYRASPQLIQRWRAELASGRAISGPAGSTRLAIICSNDAISEPANFTRLAIMCSDRAITGPAGSTRLAIAGR